MARPIILDVYFFDYHENIFKNKKCLYKIRFVIFILIPIQMKQLCTIFLLVVLSTSLHLQHTSKYDYTLTNYDDFIADNLKASNLNYYFGSLPPATYYNWVAVNNKSHQCNSLKPYARYEKDTNKFLECFACEPLGNDPTAKALFNIETRECEVCTIQKTAICNEFIKLQQESENGKVPTGTPSENASSTAQSTNQNLLDLCPPQRPLYNPQTKLCDDCPNLQQFDGPTQSCLPIIFTTNLQATNILLPAANWIDLQKYRIQQAYPTRLVQECPIQKPYLQGKSCVACQKEEVFDTTSQKCVKCNEGTLYGAQSFSCEPSIYFSDVNASNIVSQTQGYEAWKSKVQESSQLSPRMAKCPKQKPFVINGVCSSCSGNTPLFDIDRQQCGSCSQGRYYNQEKRICLGSYSTSSSLKSVIANVA